MIKRILQQKNLNRTRLEELSILLKQGSIGVFATDTIYGMHASVFKEKSIEKVYQLRKREFKKPFIILVSSFNDLNQFPIEISEKTQKTLERVWPNPVSIIFNLKENTLDYLHRGTNSLAIRMPNSKFLLEVIKNSGPLISTSVNFEGKKPAETVEEAYQYFGEQIDFYIDQGKVTSSPSTVLRLENDKFELVRQGDFVIDLNG